MKASLFRLKERVLWRDRYALLGACGFLMVSNLILGVCLMLKTDRVILIPPRVSEPISVKGVELSPSYLEEITTYFVHLIWDRTKETGVPYTNMILRHVSPETYGKIRAKLIAEFDRVQKDDIRTHFSITSMTVQGLTVKAEGVLTTYVGRELVSETRTACRLVYGFSGGMIRLKEFSEEKV